MNDTPPVPRRRSLPWTLLSSVLALLAIAAGTWYGWNWWQIQQARQAAENGKQQQRLQALEDNLEALRRDQRATRQGIQDAAATNRVLRDELLGLGQRNALLEQTVSGLADPERHGAQALRLDEVELLLSQGEKRLIIAGDLDGARRAYALAAAALEAINEPSYLNLRQSLVQERAALDAAGTGEWAKLATALQHFSEHLQQLPERSDATAAVAQPWWQKLLSPLVQIRASSDSVPVARAERTGALDALQIEISLARAALERNDEAAYRQALQRTDAWLLRLWPDTSALQHSRSELAALSKRPLRTPMPELGSTRQQLHSMREGRTQP